MLGDANTLISGLVPGRDAQQRVAVAAAREQGPLVITEAVMAEVCWVLQRNYGIARRHVATIVRDALDGNRFIAWDTELADAALFRMEREPRFAFVDCLLLERAVAGESVLTFDRDLARAIERA
jgi:predicted nucleic-acid-binding protein